tara:strand:+ start:3942 stop:6128 length:2187 start_codon:yes stop_codon:yes gene_type:complete
MKREVQLFISDTRVDLFNDESISITDSIQNVSDISKLFTPFSQQFNLPASQTNNKLFKHYYNFNIQGGFDARFKVDARIEINFVPFKTGKLRLTGVSLKDNKPHTYKVVFFGEPNNLKDIFGDEDLSSLNALSTYDIKSDTVTADVLNAFKTGLQSTGLNATNLGNRNIVVPLISLENYYSYDTPSTTRLDNVTWTNLRKDLKPAIKLKRVIEAIQTQYDITFNMADVHLDEKVLAEDTSQVITEASPSEDVILEDATSDIKTFFGSDMFDELYLWLHREKTPYTALNSTTKFFGINYTSLGFKQTLSNYSYVGGSGDILTAGKLTINEGESYTLKFRFIASAADVPIEIISRDKTTNEILGIQNRISSTSPMSVNFGGLTSGNLSSRIFNPEIRFNNNTSQAITFSAQNTLSDFGLEIIKTVNGVTTNHFYGNNSFQLAYMIFIQDYLPKMKIIDFLSGLFKMFNLVAYKRLGDSTIYVETFDDFMFEGVTRDITKYIDVSQSTIDRPIPYNQVNFNYSKPVTQTSLRFLNQFAQAFGDLEYSAPEKYDGQAFNLQVPFERSVLINLEKNAGQETNNIFSWWVDADDKTALGKPFIFFNRVIDSSSNTVTSSNITTYNAPSNVSTDENHTLNFGAEYDEFNKDINTNSLFSRFYQNYIVQTFNQNARIIKVSARLPVSFILNYRVNDVILIEGQEYYINSIKIDLTTGKSDLDLIVKTVTYTNSVLT